MDTNDAVGLTVVPCDFHSVRARGVHFRDSFSTLVLGQQVVLVDDTGEPGLRRYATVQRKDGWRMRYYFDVDWFSDAAG